VLLREVKLSLFLEVCAGAATTQDLEGRPILGEVLRDTAMGRDDGLWEMLGLVVLRGGRRRGGHLTPHECQMKAVELREGRVVQIRWIGEDLTQEKDLLTQKHQEHASLSQELARAQESNEDLRRKLSESNDEKAQVSCKLSKFKELISDLKI
jgi:hypothetical protein